MADSDTVELVPVDHNPWEVQTTPWPQDAAPLTAQQRYRASQAGDESRMPTFQRTGPTLPGMIAQSMEDTGRMMTTPPPAMPKGAYMDAGGPAQGTADPQAFADWLGEMRQRGDLAPSMALGMIGGGTAFAPKAAAGTMGTSLSYPLFHGTDQVGLDVLKPSTRGPLGPGVYTSPAEGIAKMYRPAEGGAMYQLPEQARDIYLGHGHRTDAEWFGFKEDKQRLLAAAEPEKREAIGNILDKMWSGDGYPTYQRIAQLYGNEEAAQGLYKRAGFQGISGQVDGPEVLLFGDQSLKPAIAEHTKDPALIAEHQANVERLQAKMNAPKSSNYVVFDPKMIDILRKYGIIGAAGGLGAGAMQQQYPLPFQPEMRQ